MRASQLVLSVGLALGLVTPAQAIGPAGWDHPGYDAEDSYYNPGESVINAGSVGHLTRRWAVSLRRREGACGGPSAPLLAGDRVVATDQLGISAYQPATGRPAWRFDWEDPDDSSTPMMSVSGGVLVAANGDCQSMSDPDGRIVALDLTTGRVKWRVESPFPVNSFVVDRGLVVISGGSESDDLATVAYRATDGRVAWRKAGFEGANVSAAGVLLLTRERTTAATQITTGRVLWTKPEIWYAESATPSSDRFLVTNGAALSAIDAATGAVLWTVEGKQGSFLANDGRRIFRTSEKTVEALDARTGRRMWVRQLPVAAGRPVRAGGLLYTGGPVLNPATGGIVTPGTAFAGAQIVAGGRLLTVTGNTLAAFTP